MDKKRSARESESSQIIIRVSIVTIIVNLVLVVLKTVVGLVFGNLAVVSDAIHSGSDLFTSFLIIAAVFLSSPRADKKHNYGHEKVEPLVTLFLALVILGVGIMLAVEGVRGIIAPGVSELNLYLVGVTIFSLAVKEWMFWYEIRAARKANCEMLRADAWHSRSDGLSSIAVLVGLLSSAFMETDILESIAVIIVAAFIFKVALGILRRAIEQLVDKAADDKTCAQICEIAAQTDGVCAVDNLRTRMFGNSIYVDIEIAVEGTLTVDRSHAIAQSVHDALEAAPDLHIKHCMVHVNPHLAEDVNNQPVG